MTHSTVIRVGQKLSTVTGVAFCRLGAVAVDRDGHLLGLTARHILESEADGRLFDVATGMPVGIATAGRRALAEEEEFIEAIGVILLGDAPIDDSDRLTADITVVDPKARIGKPVTKRTSDCDETPGILEGVGGSIEFEDPSTGRRTILRNVVERSFPADAKATARGEAGSPVFDGQGALIGLLMAGSAERAYAAPVMPFLERHRLRLYTSNQDPTVNSGDAEEELTRELRNAAHGATQLRQDIVEENDAARDPFTEPMPAKLLELLGSD